MIAIALFTPLWFAWGFMFLAIEGTALWARNAGKTKENWTLSALAWRNTSKKHKAARYAFMTSLVVLFTHLLWGFP
jgi:hypothetical protein